jgi:hypothetical protein
MAIQRIKSVSLAVLRLEKNRVYYIKIATAIKTGEKLDDKKEPAEICEVVNMETGEQNMLVTSTVMRKELQKQYPGDGYVGKFFELSLSRRDNKNYNDVSIVEIADPSEHFEAEREKQAAHAAELQRKVDEAKAAAAALEKDAKAAAGKQPAAPKK